MSNCLFHMHVTDTRTKEEENPEERSRIWFLSLKIRSIVNKKARAFCHSRERSTYSFPQGTMIVSHMINNGIMNGVNKKRYIYYDGKFMYVIDILVCRPRSHGLLCGFLVQLGPVVGVVGAVGQQHTLCLCGQHAAIIVQAAVHYLIGVHAQA
jgi:hypothetical protein